MKPKLIKSTFFLWIGLFALGFTNGAIRELAIKRFIEEPAAHHLSALTAIILFSGYIFLLWTKANIKKTNDALLMGFLWFIATGLTEIFALNRWIGKLTWEQILSTYDVTRGEMWPFVLIWIGILPCVIFWIKGPSLK